MATAISSSIKNQLFKLKFLKHIVSLMTLLLFLKTKVNKLVTVLVLKFQVQKKIYFPDLCRRFYTNLCWLQSQILSIILFFFNCKRFLFFSERSFVTISRVVEFELWRWRCCLSIDRLPWGGVEFYNCKGWKHAMPLPAQTKIFLALARMTTQWISKLLKVSSIFLDHIKHHKNPKIIHRVFSATNFWPNTPLNQDRTVSQFRNPTAQSQKTKWRWLMQRRASATKLPHYGRFRTAKTREKWPNRR